MRTFAPPEMVELFFFMEIDILGKYRYTLITAPMYDCEDTVCGLIYSIIDPESGSRVSESFFFLKNLQGDNIAITGQNGRVVAKYAYDAWGKCTIVEDISERGIATVNPYRYRSYYYDPEIGMYYLQSRYYDPAVGRFVNGDKSRYLGVGSTLMCYNLYTYCENNLLTFIDVTGLYSLSLRDFNSDWVGRTILSNYLYGGGAIHEYSSWAWANYMKKCKMCSSCCGYKKNLTLEQYINDYVRSQSRYLKPLKTNQTKTIRRTKSVSIQNGEGIIGYNYLHGTNATVGGLSLKITSRKFTSPFFKSNIYVDIQCTWNDIIDPNFSYSSDSYKASIAKNIPFANPTNYFIRISWTQHTTI